MQKKNTVRILCAVGVALALAPVASPAFAGGIVLGDANTEAGQSVTLPVTYNASGEVAVAVASDIRFKTTIFSNPRCIAGPALPANKSVRCGNPSKGILRMAIFGLNADPLPSGELARITFDVSPNAKPGRYKFRNKPSAADKDGKDFRLSHGHGAVRVARKLP